MLALDALDCLRSHPESSSWSGQHGWDVRSGPARGLGSQSLVFQSRLAVPAVHPELCREISAPARFGEGSGVEWEERWVQTDLCSELGPAPHYLCHLRQVTSPGRDNLPCAGRFLDLSEPVSSCANEDASSNSEGCCGG